MKTEQIYVNGEEARIAAAMDKTMAFAELVGLDSKQSLRLRLIAEEILGLLSGITDNDYTALFWIEGDARKCETHLAAKIDMTADRREELLATATTGRNEAATGIMGKIRDMIGDAVVDDSRILQEVAIYSDKVCIDEELVRLKSHIGAVVQTLKEEGSIGRKLDFLAQELNREANTILSKTDDAESADCAIMLKTEIEKIREQIQNVE